MEKAEISRLINSFQAIKGYFDTTKKYMPQIAKLVFFIEEIIPLLQSIHKNINQSTELIPSAAEKLDKVTSATELATTEVMDIVDNVISRLNQMTENVDALETCIAESSSSDASKEKIEEIRNQINGSQDDLFSIMNALQFQDITTQQINGIASVIDSVQIKLSELLQGFDDGGEISSC
jgi:chemotaxis regulatin CheY-phosphate phosphatase CheZ